MFWFLEQVSPREITEACRQIEIKTNDLCENVLYQWLHGCIQPSNLSSALVCIYICAIVLTIDMMTTTTPSTN